MQYCWKSDEYDALEACSIMETAAGFHIVSHIGLRNGSSVNYELTVDSSWNTKRFLVSSHIGEEVFAADGERDAAGRWTINGLEMPEYDNCTDIDITLTPFTNTLPVKRPRLLVGGKRQIEVIYIDPEERKISLQKQLYIRKTTDVYHFETVPNDFEADIRFGEDGFVESYPGLFERIGCNNERIQEKA
jgi:uncharacterized protein